MASPSSSGGRMSDEKIRRIRERASAGTPGLMHIHAGTSSPEHVALGNTVICVKDGTTIAVRMGFHDADLLAHAREDLLELLEEHDELVRATNGLREEVFRFVSFADKIAYSYTPQAAMAREVLHGRDLRAAAHKLLRAVEDVPKVLRQAAGVIEGVVDDEESACARDMASEVESAAKALADETGFRDD